MTTSVKATRERADRIACPTCGKNIAADLYIEANEKGFKKVHLGMQCQTCKTVHRDFVKVFEAKAGAR